MDRLSWLGHVEELFSIVSTRVAFPSGGNINLGLYLLHRPFSGDPVAAPKMCFGSINLCL
jgi:hypothetical protein